MHDRGEVHGALTPAHLALPDEGLELLPVSRSTAPQITPYTAPEVAEGRAPDARSDIFAFGAILFEMLTGRRPFEGHGTPGQPPAPSSGSPAVDHLLGPCLASYDSRPPRMQRVMLELKLLTAAARRAEAAAAPRRQMVDAAILRGEIRELKAGLEARLAELDESLGAVRDRVAALELTIDAMRHHQQHFARTVAAEVRDIEESVKTQTAALESARTAMSQTDDLVERVVEALEALQTAVLDSTDGTGGPSSFAIN
jgi:hypothetical protein